LEHLHSTVDLGKVAVWHVLWWLVADTELEASWAPVNELNSALSLESGDSAVGILWNNVTTVEQAGCHVFAVAWVTFDHLVIWLEAGHCDLLDGVGLVSRLGGRNNWGVGDEREVDTWVWHQVGLELVQVDVEGSVETERSGDGGND